MSDRAQVSHLVGIVCAQPETADPLAELRREVMDAENWICEMHQAGCAAFEYGLARKNEAGESSTSVEEAALHFGKVFERETEKLVEWHQRLFHLIASVREQDERASK
ncbi:MAG: hypothetical protein AAFY56_10440 [Pseudomonadota bacterium]